MHWRATIWLPSSWHFQRFFAVQKLPLSQQKTTCLQALFTLYGFTFPITVALLQMAVIAPVCYAVARPKLEWGLARGIIPLAVVNVLNVVCGLIGKRQTPMVQPPDFSNIALSIVFSSGDVHLHLIWGTSTISSRHVIILSPLHLIKLVPCRHCWSECPNVHRASALHSAVYHCPGEIHDGKEA